MTAPDPQARRERTWLVIGALAGVLVAGVIVALLIVAGNKGATPPTRPLPSTTRSASGPAGAQLGTARDDSLRAAEEAAVTLNTLDYKAVQQGLDRWEALATTPLLDQLRSRRADAAATVEKAKTASTAKVLAAAASKVNPDASSADVLVVVEVTTTDAKNASTTKQLRERLSVLQTAQGWKISAATVVEPAG